MNKAILIGRLANDPELRTTQSGISCANFRLAVNRRFKNAQGVREADFINIVCWRQTADFAANYLTKGKLVAIEGSIQTRSYDAKDGTKRYVTEIVTDSLDILERKSDGEYSAQKPAPSEEPAQKNDTFQPVDDDELPF